MGQGYGADYQIAALFHDLLEDTDAKEQEIAEIGGEKGCWRQVRLLTKTKGYNMAEYVAGIRSNPIAFAVKARIGCTNLRCALVTDEEFKRRYILETLDWYLEFDTENSCGSEGALLNL